MRLFVALEPPAAALEEVEAVVALQRERGPDLRWVPRERWHVTLSFLGEVGEEHLERLRPRLHGSASACPPLQLSFAGAGAFPRAARGRVLWIGMDGDLTELTRLAGSVAEAARASGIRQEKREFSGHLTVARSRQAGDLRSLVQALSGCAGSPWTADRIHLVRSHLGPNPRYETLEAWSLGGPAQR